MVAQADKGMVSVALDAAHPDISFKALWGKVWYENYDEPKYIWQSSAANTDFEPKYSLMPLVFGVMFAFFPSGLVLYWVVQNLLSIAQQWHINKTLAAEAAAKAKGKR